MEAGLHHLLSSFPMLVFNLQYSLIHNLQEEAADQ
jgi:hypothetical protein